MDPVDLLLLLLVVLLLYVLTRDRGLKEVVDVDDDAVERMHQKRVRFDPTERSIRFRKDLPPNQIGVERLVAEKQIGKGTMVAVLAKDGKKYDVVDSPQKQEVADFLAEIRYRLDVLVYHLQNRLAQGNIVFEGEEITKCIRRLVRKHKENGHTFSELWDPTGDSVAANTNKGQQLEICVRDRNAPHSLNSLNTAMRVALHELAHSADKYYRFDHDHGDFFYRLQSFLMEEAVKVKVYSCKQYDQEGPGFCGLTLPDDLAKCNRPKRLHATADKTVSVVPKGLGSMLGLA